MPPRFCVLRSRFWLGPAVVALLLTCAGFAHAQTASEPTGTAGKAAARPAPPIDVNRLPVDLRRIERAFRQPTIREEHNGLNLRYFVDVYGQAPPIVLFTREDNLFYGPVPYGAPTHREMIDMVTPQEHRAPAANLGNLLRWWTGKSSQERRR